jgi:hypothetical protein
MNRDERGFVAIEWVSAIGFLLLPIVMLVATLPVWAERKHAATVAAREAARVLVRDWPAGSAERATTVAREVAADHGIGADDVTVRMRAANGGRGDEVRVEVDVVMPAIEVGSVRTGAWRYTAHAVRRIDDYRSR